MGQAYTPALQVTANTVVRKLRELPLPGKTLVKAGDQVEADTPVLSAELPGDMTIIRVADRLGFEVEDVISGMKVKPGDSVKTGQELAKVSGFFGLIQSSLASPADGVVEFFTESNAHLGIRHPSIPLTVDAYVRGRVVEVEEGKSVTIETKGGFIQGIFGVGGERRGEIFALDIAPDEMVAEAYLKSLGVPLKGKILIGGKGFEKSALDYLCRESVSACVCGSIDAETLRSFVGHEIGVSITGDENVGCTLIVTEGFGALPISDRVRALAKELHGRKASVNGATQVRAGATRPEIIVPLEGTIEAGLGEEPDARYLEIGARLRIIRVPYFGAFGTVTELPSEPEVIPTGAKVRVLRARLDSGEVVTVPRANVELI